MGNMYDPPHPGAVLREWIGEMSVTRVAEQLKVSRVTLSRLLNGNAGVSADMALRLEAALGTSPEMWMSLQMAYDLWQARQQERPDVLPILQAA